jgi:hypothetical protein
VDLDSFLRFNAWIDGQLIELEKRMAAFRRPARTSRSSARRQALSTGSGEPLLEPGE